MDEKKLGQILLDKDVITKRQLQSAIQLQVNGDDRKIGEILILDCTNVLNRMYKFCL